MVKSDLKATVVLPDDNEIVFDVHPRIKGIDLFNSACENLNLLERDYFGLSYQDEAHVRYWLDMDKKLSKIFTTFPLVFFFEMKFYPPDPALLQEDYTRYLLCLQVRNDINNSRLPCSFVTYALLGSYLVQSQLGDFDEQVHGPGTGYLKDFQFAPNPVEGLEDRVIELHKQHRGQTPAEAELHYLETAKKLAMYGVELFPAIDSFGVEIAIGVCASGLSVYKDRLKMNRFAWPKILKISYRRHNFYIKIRPGEFEQVESTIGFKLANRKFAKRLWKTAVEHHTFFRLTDADSPIKSKFLFFRLGSKFRYSGRTQYQSRQSIIARPQPQFTRSLTSIVSRRTSDLRVRPQLGDQRILSSVGLDTTITPPEGPQKGTENQVAPQPDTSLEEETLTKKYKKPVGGVAVLPPMDMKRLEEQRKSPLPPDRPHSRSPGFVNEAYRGSPGPQFTGQDEFYNYGPPLSSSSPKIGRKNKKGELNESTNPEDYKVHSDSYRAKDISAETHLSSGTNLFKSQSSAFTREYLYTIDKDNEKHLTKPIKEYGFIYANVDENPQDFHHHVHQSAAITPASNQSSKSNELSEQKATGVAFTYCPQANTDAHDNISSSRSQPTAKSINPRISPTSGYHSSNLIKELATRQQQQAHTRPDTAYHTKRFERNSHGFHSGPDHLNRSRTTPSPGPGTTSVTPDAGGRISRQSGLESSSESPISSSESSLDEYADENTDPLIVKKLTKKSKDNNKQVVSKEVNESSTYTKPIVTTDSHHKHHGHHESCIPEGHISPHSSFSRPKIMHASRKKTITKSDGTVEEIEEVVEPSEQYALPRLSYADSKPHVVGTIPSDNPSPMSIALDESFANDYGLPRRSPIPPHVSETSRVLTSQTSTSTTRNYPNKDEDKSYSKMSTVEEKEKTIGTKISETSKIITGNFEDVEALLREEGFDTSKVRVGIEPMPIKTEETQKFSYTTAKDHDDHTASSFIRTDNSSTSWKEKTPSTSTQNRPAERPRDVGDFISSQAVSTKMKTVETLTYKMEKDGVLETRMEQKIVVKSDGESPIDHDRALADAIQQATMMSPDMTVEKIEIKQSDKN
ncbi:uncharacterized protein LOC141858735 isoform X2 [Brevipalpus obovatus]|uniref:uncharacterized protein LOC141858735 isoform X2 n=1 Tax=Brevipalpus obovatus TaxID=246614 RepID=UPI003D9E46F4